MTKTLTDDSTFDDVVVPVDTEDADAASVETPFQTLADRTRYLRDIHADDAPQLNWIEPDDTSVSTMGTPLAGDYGPYAQTFHFIDGDGNTGHSVSVATSPSPAGGAGESFSDESATPTSVLSWTASASAADIKTDYATAAREKRLATSNSGTGQVAFSTGIGTWAAPPSGISGTTWWCCARANAGWLIGGASGALAWASDSTLGFSSRTSNLSGTIFQIASNAKSKALASQTFLAIDSTGTEVSKSTDGTASTWAATAHGLGSPITRLDWSEKGARWIGVCEDGRRCFSDDGETWTDDTDALPNLPSSPGFQLNCLTDGKVCITATSTTERTFYLSTDDGETWEQLSHTQQYTKIYGAMAAGAGRFVTYGVGGPLASLRGRRDGF